MIEIPFTIGAIYRIKWRNKSCKDYVIGDYQLIETGYSVFMLKRHDTSRLGWDIRDTNSTVASLKEYLEKTMVIDYIEFVARKLEGILYKYSRTVLLR